MSILLIIKIKFINKKADQIGQLFFIIFFFNSIKNNFIFVFI